MTYDKEEIHINDIKPGDTILHYGELKTVCKNNIKKDSFMGTTIFGDSYKLGYTPVIKVTNLKF